MNRTLCQSSLVAHKQRGGNCIQKGNLSQVKFL